MRALDQKIDTAVTKRDAATLESILADDFIYTHSNGRSQPKAEFIEAIARRDAARAQIDVLRQQLAADFGEAVASRNEAIEQINLHVEQLVPEAKLGFESALASYQTGKSTFDSVLGALQTYRTLNVDYYEFLRQLLIAEAEIDALKHGATGRSGTALMNATMGGMR